MTGSVLGTFDRWATWVLRGVSLAIEIGLLIIGLSVIFSDSLDPLSGMVAWDLLAVLYLIAGLIGIWLMPHGHTVEDGRSAGPTGTHPVVASLLGFYWGLLPVVFSLLGLVAALDVLFLDHEQGRDLQMTMKGAGAVAIVTAWILLHVSYARRYRWIYHRHDGGLEFPGDGDHAPTSVDFLYFSMTMGASFATSDVNVTDTRMRAHVIVHSVLSFFYNAVVLAVAFRVLTGG